MQHRMIAGQEKDPLNTSEDQAPSPSNLKLHLYHILYFRAAIGVLVVYSSIGIAPDVTLVLHHYVVDGGKKAVLYAHIVFIATYYVSCTLQWKQTEKYEQ